MSTDFVFSGNKNIAYTNLDKPSPINVYGLSKLKGEEEVLKFEKNFVVRTSWLYSPYGKNFLKTMLRLHDLKHKSNEPLRVISDQIGCPTSCKSLSMRAKLYKMIILKIIFFTGGLRSYSW